MSLLLKHRLFIVSVGLLLLAACNAGSNEGDPGPDAAPEPQGFPGPCQINTDLGLDGTIDRRDTRTYMDNKLLSRIEQDNNVDGAIDRIQTRIYDSAGRLFMLDDDTNADGIIDVHQSYTYNSDGLLDQIDIDNLYDGTVDRVQVHRYDGEKRLVVIEDDLNNDGVPDQRFQHKYNVGNQLTLIERDDAPFDGVIVTREHRSYDDALLKSREFDDNADGTIDRRIDFVRDGKGDIIQVEHDNDVAVALGSDDREYWTYDCFTSP